MKNFWGTYLGFVRAPTAHRGEMISIQWLRGLAVLMVTIYHTEDILRLMPGWQDFGMFWVHLGYSAPDLFFVISGFIMCYVTFNTRFNPHRWLIARITRIYPLYLLFMAVAIAVWLIDPSMTMGSGEQTWATIGKSLLIFPQDRLPLLFVAWTLEHEIIFYFLIFCVASLGGGIRALTNVMMVLSLIAGIRWALKDSVFWLNFWDYHLISLYMIEFTTGALIFRFQKNLQFLGAVFPAAAGLCLVVLGGVIVETTTINEETLPRIIFFGIAHGLFLLGFVNREMERRRKEGDDYLPQKRPFMVRVGDASYSLYLSHPFFLSAGGKIMSAVGVSGYTAASLVTALGLSAILFGMAFYELVEKPLLQAMKILTGKKKRSQVTCQ